MNAKEKTMAKPTPVVMKVAVEPTLVVSRSQLEAAFDRWMDDFSNHPERFEQIVSTVRRHLAERTLEQAPSYGQSCAQTLMEYVEAGPALRVSAGEDGTVQRHRKSA